MSAISARFSQPAPDPEEFSFSFPSSSSSISTASTSAYEFGVEAGIIPSATMLSSTPFPIQTPPVQHPSIPFISACARIAEFERLREELRETEASRERQMERLSVLACQSTYELPEVPQVRLPPPYMRVCGV